VKKPIYKVAIVGAGSIGAMKADKYDSPKGKNILTHAHAVVTHPRTELKYIVDSNAQKALAAAKKWGCLALATMKDLVGAGIDIVILATPTDLHYEHLLYIIDYIKPRLIIAEKPFCSNLEQAKKILHKSKQKDISIIVDYIRRFDPELQRLKKEMAAGAFGPGGVLHAKLTYTRGLVHEACHAIDMFNYLFGKFIRGEILNGNGSVLEDRSFNDPTYAAHLAYEYCPHVFLCPADGRKFAIFDFEILFETRKISLTHTAII
jgi:predicted dehydrogenase